MDLWAANGGDIDLDALRGRRCIAGLIWRG